MDRYVPLKLYSSIVQCSMPGQEETKHIELPYETFAEVPEEIKYIRSLVEFLNNPRQYNLPDTYQDMFILADFLGCDIFLDFVSSALRVQKNNILYINSVSSVRRLIRNKYRQNKYNSCKFVCGGCFSCISVHLPPRKPVVFPLFKSNLDVQHVYFPFVVCSVIM